MCDSNSQVLIDQVIQGKVDQKQSFTAFDISLEVKRRGGKERHRDMKSYIHQSMETHVDFGDYNKSSIPIAGGTPPYAILYYHSSVDPSTYHQLNRGNQQTQNSVQTVCSTNASSISSDDSSTQNNISTISITSSSDDLSDEDDEDVVGVIDDGSFLLDSRERLLIPTKFIRDIGLNAGETAFLVKGSDCLQIEANSGMAFATLTIEKHGEIRISASNLANAGIFDKSGYNIFVENGKVVVKRKG